MDNQGQRAGSLESRVAEARSALAGGDPGRAVHLCADLIAAYPESGEALALMGDAYAVQHDWNLAIEYYEQALDRSFNPDVMERLAAARRASIRVSSPDTAAPSMRVTAPGRPAGGVRAKASPYLVAAVVIGVLLIPLLAAALLRTTSDSGDDEMAGDTPASARQALPAGDAAGSETYIDQPVRPAAPEPAPGPAAASGGSQAIGTAAARPQTAAPSQQTAPQVPSYPRQTGRQRGGERAVASAREKKIMGQLELHRAGAGQSAARATALALDDYSGTGILTIAIPPTVDMNRLQSDVLLAAFSAAAGTARTDRGVKALIVRCLSRLPDEQGQLDDVMVFRAAVTADAVRPWVEQNRTPSIQQIANEIFRDVWWDQQALARYIARVAEEAKKGRQGDGR